jgi:hypothetical protein
VVLGSISLAQTVKKPKTTLRSGLLHLCCWAAVAVAAIMDIRLMFNTLIIREHGLWIKSIEKILLGKQSPLGWESYFSEQSVLWHSPVRLFASTDRQLLTAVLFILALYLWVRYPRSDGGDVFQWINKWMAYLCLVLLAFPKMYSGSGFLVNFLLLVLAICIIAGWSRASARETELERGTQKP